MAWVEIDARDFERAIQEQLQADSDLARRAAYDASLRGVSRAVKQTKQAGKVDRGQFMAAWKALQTEDGAELVNDAPYAAVIEHGRRPGKPGPPLAPIYEWVQRKLRGQIKAQFRVVRALSFSAVDAGTGTRRQKAAARKQLRSDFGHGDRAVDVAAWGIAMAIRDKIHAKGTPPSFILRRVAVNLGPDFFQAAVRQLQRRHGG